MIVFGKPLIKSIRGKIFISLTVGAHRAGDYFDRTFTCLNFVQTVLPALRVCPLRDKLPNVG